MARMRRTVSFLVMVGFLLMAVNIGRVAATDAETTPPASDSSMATPVADEPTFEVPPEETASPAVPPEDVIEPPEAEEEDLVVPGMRAPDPGFQLAAEACAPAPGVELSGCIYNGLDLRGSDFSGANLAGATFNGANISGVNFSHADLTAATLNGADISGANFTGANLTAATLDGADVRCANFNSANLTSATLDGAILAGSTFQGAILTSATWGAGTTCLDGTVSGANGGTCVGHLDSIGACAPAIVKATPLLTLAQVPNPVNIGESFTVHMTLSSEGITPTGVVTLSAYVDSDCSLPLPGAEPYSTALVDGAIADPPPAVFDFAGVFYRQAVYAGDANNVAASSSCEAVAVETNPLTVSITGGALEPVDYAQAASVNNGFFVMTVTDERATGEGWSISVLASEFAFAGSSSTGKAIPARNLSITSAEDPLLLWGQPVGPGGPFANPDALGTLDQSRAVATANAGYGTGSYAFMVGIALGIPAESQSGTYTATLEVLILAAP